MAFLNVVHFDESLNLPTLSTAAAQRAHAFEKLAADLKMHDPDDSDGDARIVALVELLLNTDEAELSAEERDYLVRLDVAGLEVPSAEEMSESMQEQRFTAIHEAAHVVAAIRTEIGASRTTIEPTDATLGVARFINGSPPGDPDGLEADKARLLVSYAGYCAQIVAGDSEERARQGANQDFADAAPAREAWSLSVDECLAAAFAFVRDSRNWSAIELVASKLLEATTIDGDELDILVSVADGEITAEQYEHWRSARRG